MKNRPPPTVPAAAADSPSAHACAAAVLDVVPGVMDAMRAAMRRHAGSQLSVPQFRCLAFIKREPGASIGAVAAFLGVSMPTASAMVDRLARAGAIAPSADPDDRRRQRLHITAEGDTQLADIRGGAHNDLAQRLASCQADDLPVLLAGLDALRRCFDSNPTAPVSN